MKAPGNSFSGTFDSGGKADSRDRDRIYRVAQKYYMSNYRTRHSGGTGYGYCGQVVLAIGTAAIMTAFIVLAIVRLNATAIWLPVIGLIAAFIWMICAMNRGVDMAIGARDFAAKAKYEVEKTEDIPQYFDATFPWVFHEQGY